MKIIYDLTPTGVSVSPTKTDLLVLTLEEGVSTTVKAGLDRKQAVALRRALARLTGLSGDDPTGEGYSIAELVEFRRIVKVGELDTERAEILDIIDAYIRLIEATAQKEAVS